MGGEVRMRTTLASALYECVAVEHRQPRHNHHNTPNNSTPTTVTHNTPSSCFNNNNATTLTKSSSNTRSSMTKPAKDAEETKDNSLSQHNEVNNNKYYLPQTNDWPWVWAIRDGTYLDWGRYIRGFDHSLAAQLVCAHTNLPVEIIPHKLYLSDAEGIHNTARLKHLKITGVLNMADTPSNHKLFKKTNKILQQQGISYHGIAAEDQTGYPLLYLHMDEAFATIDRVVAQKNGKGRCVVNCAMGKNRSVLIVAAYAMLHDQTPVLDTLRHIRYQRGNGALVNESFQEQLVALARHEKLLGGKPGTNEDSICRVAAPHRTVEWQTNERGVERALQAHARALQDPLWKRALQGSYSSLFGAESSHSTSSS